MKNLAPQQLTRIKRLGVWLMLSIICCRVEAAWTARSSAHQRSQTFAVFRHLVAVAFQNNYYNQMSTGRISPRSSGSHEGRCKPLFITTASVGNINNTESLVHEAATIFEMDEDDALEEIETDDLEVVEDTISMEVADEADDDFHLLDESQIAKLPRGIPNDYAIVKNWTIPSEGLNLSPAENDPDRQANIERLKLTATDLSLPVALTLLFPDQYFSLSQARRICRKGYFLLHRGEWLPSEDGTFVVDRDKCKVGRVGDRVHPGDVIAKQVRVGSGNYRGMTMNHAKPPFDVPVLYEDDHFAAINKPAGYVVHGNGATIRSVLPFCLKPPRKGTWAVLRRPIGVHRLDKPTSGILLSAKTRPAMVDLARQFSQRVTKKTYLAIVNGIPAAPPETSISSQQAFELGVDVDPKDESSSWQLINFPLDDKASVTVWRALRCVPSRNANDGHVTLVELKPKTGRFHQLRRHMAWVCQKPLVGDDEYDGGRECARSFREHGLFLCSNRMTLEHPFYNTESGRKVWEGLDEASKYANGTIWLHENGKLMVTIAIDVPSKFQTFLEDEEQRYHKFSGADQLQQQTEVKESSRSH